MDSTRPEIRVGEWSAEAPDLLRFATERAAPRSGSWWNQLKRDLRSPQMWAVGAAGAGSIILGVRFRNPLVVFSGSMTLCLLVVAYISVSRRFAVSELVRG